MRSVVLCLLFVLPMEALAETAHKLNLGLVPHATSQKANHPEAKKEGGGAADMIGMKMISIPRIFHQPRIGPVIVPFTEPPCVGADGAIPESGSAAREGCVRRNSELSKATIIAN